MHTQAKPLSAATLPLHAGLPPSGRQHLLQPGWAYVVEDAPAARRFAEACLRRIGWRVFAFPDAASCVTALADYAPEALVLDIGLPDGSGQIVAARIRRNSRTARMRVIAYTGLDPEEFPVLQEVGFDGVIAKPGSLEAFQRLLPLSQSQALERAA